MAFHREGSVYVTRRDVVMEGNSLYGRRLAGYLLDPERCVNIDGPEDWERAEQLLNLLITPHTGGATAESMAATEVFMAEELRQFLEKNL